MDLASTLLYFLRRRALNSLGATASQGVEDRPSNSCSSGEAPSLVFRMKKGKNHLETEFVVSRDMNPGSLNPEAEPLPAAASLSPWR